MRVIHTFAAALALASTGAAAAQPRPEPLSTVVAAEPFAIAANPLATRAGLNVLRRGGSAIDAAIAMQAMLSLVEPQSSSVAGGSFLTYLDGRTGKLTIYDGREVAPAQATSTMFLGDDGRPLPFNLAVLSGRATGVPGVLKMLDLAHREHGKLPWNSLFSEAEQTAANGFIV